MTFLSQDATPRQDVTNTTNADNTDCQKHCKKDTDSTDYTQTVWIIG